MNFTFTPNLNKDQLRKLSDIASDTGLVALASVVLPAALDRFDATMILLGSVATVFFWSLSIWIRR